MKAGEETVRMGGRGCEDKVGGRRRKTRGDQNEKGNEYEEKGPRPNP